MNGHALDEMNIPCRLVGWASEGAGRVELLSQCGDYDIGSVMTVTVRPNPKAKTFDFDYFRKNLGLRAGGIVLLRRLRIEDDSHASIREMDVLLARDTFGPAFVVQNAAVSILPPPPNTRLVDRALVAMPDEGLRIRTLKEGAAQSEAGLKQAATFGLPGLVLTGEDADGEVIEIILGGEEGVSIADVLYSLEKGLDGEIASLVKTAYPKWHLVPFFMAKVDPDLNSKVSAQRANLDYGDGEIFSWTRSNCVLRAFGDAWLLADASIIHDGSDREALPLLDLLDP